MFDAVKIRVPSANSVGIIASLSGLGIFLVLTGVRAVITWHMGAAYGLEDDVKAIIRGYDWIGPVVAGLIMCSLVWHLLYISRRRAQEDAHRMAVIEQIEAVLLPTLSLKPNRGPSVEEAKSRVRWVLNQALEDIK